ncbi:MAG TPA: YnfA family protein [Euzebyales bacterium]|nr:YnfA family protein [Euzebyales bacterium]
MRWGAYEFVATCQPFQHFGRILAAYGGVFVAGSLAWGVAFDGFRPDRFDLIGAAICLVGVTVIMYTPRAARGELRPTRVVASRRAGGRGSSGDVDVACAVAVSRVVVVELVEWQRD